MPEKEPLDDYSAPDYTVIERVSEGLVVVTRVLMNGEFMEFTKPNPLLNKSNT